MHAIPAIDPGRVIDWGKTSDDYARHRPGPPDSFFARLASLGVGLPGQCVLDLGTGTGVLARRFAQAGCKVCASDISAEQITVAQRLAAHDGVSVKWHVARAEDPVFQPQAFDVVTANQCWLYFDPDAVLREVRRVLRPGGVLVTSHFSWLPRRDRIARDSEELVLKFNPQWQGANWAGQIPAQPRWAAERDVRVRSMFWYDEPVAFSREGWAGRMRACRGVAAALSADEVRAFDAAHQALLHNIAPESFSVLHRIDAHLLDVGQPRSARVATPHPLLNTSLIC